MKTIALIVLCVLLVGCGCPCPKQIKTEPAWYKISNQYKCMDFKNYVPGTGEEKECAQGPLYCPSFVRNCIEDYDKDFVGNPFKVYKKKPWKWGVGYDY